MPRIITTSMKKTRRVIVVGDSLLRGAEGPVCQAPLTGQSAVSLGPRLRTSLGESLAWYCPWTTTHYWSSMRVVMKLQPKVQGNSKGLVMAGKGM